MARVFRSLTLATLIGLGLAPSALAQDNVLSLKEAIATAEANSPTIRVSQAGIRSTQARKQEAIGGAFPQLSLSTNLMRFGLLGSSTSGAGSLGGLGGLGMMGGLGGLGGLGMMGGLGSSGPNQFQVQLSANQVLFDGFRTADALKISGYSEQLSEIDLYNTRRTVAFNAANAYLNLLRAQSLLDVARLGVEQAREQVRVAETRLKSGVGTRFEVLQAETPLASAESNYVQAANGVTLARQSLETQLGQGLQGRRLDPTVNIPRVRLADVDMQAAIENRPEVQQLALNQQIQEQTATLNSRAYLPTVAAIASLTSQPGGMSYYIVGGSVSWSILDGGKTAAKVDQAEAEVEKAAANLDNTRRNLALDFQNAVQTTDSAQTRLTISQRGLQSANVGLKLAQTRYDAGVGTSIDVINAMAAQAQAQSGYVQALYDVQSSQLQLAQSLGLSVEDIVR